MLGLVVVQGIGKQNLVRIRIFGRPCWVAFFDPQNSAGMTWATEFLVFFIGNFVCIGYIGHKEDVPSLQLFSSNDENLFFLIWGRQKLCNVRTERNSCARNVGSAFALCSVVTSMFHEVWRSASVRHAPYWMAA